MKLSHNFSHHSIGLFVSRVAPSALLAKQALLQREADQRLNLTRDLAAKIEDYRRGPVNHTMSELLRTSIMLAALGWRDQDDADFLRHDPALVGTYQAVSWSKKRRIFFVLQEKPGEIFLHYFWLVTILAVNDVPADELLPHYRQRGTAEGTFGELMDAIRPDLSSNKRPKTHYRDHQLPESERKTLRFGPTKFD